MVKGSETRIAFEWVWQEWWHLRSLSFGKFLRERSRHPSMDELDLYNTKAASMEHGLQTTAVYWEGQMNSWRGVFGQAGWFFCSKGHVGHVLQIEKCTGLLLLVSFHNNYDTITIYMLIALEYVFMYPLCSYFFGHGYIERRPTAKSGLGSWWMTASDRCGVSPAVSDEMPRDRLTIVDNRWHFREPHCQVWMLVTWQKNHLSSTEQGRHVFFLDSELPHSLNWYHSCAFELCMLLSCCYIGCHVASTWFYHYISTIDICGASRHIRIEATSGSIMETKTFMISSPGLGLKSFHISHQISPQMDPFTNLRPTKKRFNFSFFPTGSTDPLNRPLWCYGLLCAVHR